MAGRERVWFTATRSEPLTGVALGLCTARLGDRGRWSARIPGWNRLVRTLLAASGSIDLDFAQEASAIGKIRRMFALFTSFAPRHPQDAPAIASISPICARNDRWRHDVSVQAVTARSGEDDDRS